MTVVTSITALRHGNAERKVDTGNTRDDDLVRRLSETGVAQAKNKTDLFNQETATVLTSPALRAQYTAELVCDNVVIKATHILPELYTPVGKDGERLDADFERLGYAPAATYLAQDTFGAWRRFEATAGKAIASKIQSASDGNINDFVVGGHAVYTNVAIAGALYELGYEVPDYVIKVIYALELPEVGAFTITFIDGKFASLEIF
ncbi:MAG: hypothetical protein AB199_03395 [Parcubacteria bacterium C7867-004]|nr:MAG: hypothetical protein AB199_03395 [Parcubacteria bacterium C7867-004]